MSDRARRRGLAIGPPVMGGLYAVVGFWSPFVVGSRRLPPVLALVAWLGGADQPVEPRPADPGHVR